MNQDYSSHYNDSDFWGKVKKHAKKAGAKVLQPAFELYYASKQKRRQHGQRRLRSPPWVILYSHSMQYRM